MCIPDYQFKTRTVNGLKRKKERWYYTNTIRSFIVDQVNKVKRKVKLGGKVEITQLK